MELDPHGPRRGGTFSYSHVAEAAEDLKGIQACDLR